MGEAKGSSWDKAGQRSSEESCSSEADEPRSSQEIIGDDEGQMGRQEEGRASVAFPSLLQAVS
jgi:hypothetical protein